MLFSSPLDSVMGMVPLYSLTDVNPRLLLSSFSEGPLPPDHPSKLVGVAVPSKSRQVNHKRSSSEACKPTKNHTQSSAQIHSTNSHSSTTQSSSSDSSAPLPRLQTIIPPGETEHLIRHVVEHKSGPVVWDSRVSNRELYMLLFSVLESVCSVRESRGTSKITSTLRLLQSVTHLFEDTLGLWLQQQQQQHHGKVTQFAGSGWRGEKHGQSRRTRSADHITLKGEGGASSDHTTYSGCLHLARITLRLWLNLSSQLLHSSLLSQHLSEIQPLLHAPLETVSKACYNLQEAGIFRGNDSLDHEFTLVILEGLFSGLYVINLFPNVPLCLVEGFYGALRDALTDSCQEWFAYLCSKLHGISESSHVTPSHSADDQATDTERGQEENGSAGSAGVQSAGVQSADKPQVAANWHPVLTYSYSLLTYILAELLRTHSHIKNCQQAFKLVLASTGAQPSMPHLFPFHRPVTYSLEVATGFDKVTFRLSKMAELLLSMFKEVPRVQLLSLQLLSETTKDTIGVIGNFLSIISDRRIYSNSKVLDPYLELLEDIWFRLSPDYSGSAPWSKLSNYSSLLMESDFQVVCQVIYHLQCLFSHESSSLKSQLTKRVITPYHAHLMGLVKGRCFKAKTIVTNERGGAEKGAKKTKSAKGSQVTQVVQMGFEADLGENERAILSLFLKLLAKVVSHPQSLGVFAASSSNLYSLFLLLPLDGFRSAGLRVLEECLYTVHNFGGTPANSPTGSNVSSPMGKPPGGGVVGGAPSAVSPQHAESASRQDETGIQKTLLLILLSVAYSVQIERIPDQCLSIAEGRATLRKYGLAEADEVHNLIVSTFEHKTLKQLLTEGFIRHISVMTDVWSLLARLATHNDAAAEILRCNHIWDVIQVFGPSLANVMSRLRQRQSRDSKDVSEVEGSMQSLNECGVGLLSHLLVLAHYLCWTKRDQRVGRGGEGRGGEGRGGGEGGREGRGGEEGREGGEGREGEEGREGGRGEGRGGERLV